MSQNHFDIQQELPSSKLESIAKTLIGFEKHYKALKNHLTTMLLPDHVNEWSKKYYKKNNPIM